MGAWDHNIFGNDDACDWKYELDDLDDLSHIEQTLDTVFEEGEEYLEAPEASCALAAIETLTRLLGRGGKKDAYTESMDEWVAAHPQEVPAPLIAKANRAIDRILAPESELAELWEESGDADWKASVEDVRARLNG